MKKRQGERVKMSKRNLEEETRKVIEPRKGRLRGKGIFSFLTKWA